MSEPDIDAIIRVAGMKIKRDNEDISPGEAAAVDAAFTELMAMTAPEMAAVMMAHRLMVGEPYCINGCQEFMALARAVAERLGATETRERDWPLFSPAPKPVLQ